jgi:hypothetical protein
MRRRAAVSVCVVNDVPLEATDHDFPRMNVLFSGNDAPNGANFEGLSQSSFSVAGPSAILKHRSLQI